MSRPTDHGWERTLLSDQALYQMELVLDRAGSPHVFFVGGHGWNDVRHLFEGQCPT